MLELTTTRRARPWYLVVTAALSALAVLVPLRVVAAEPAPRSAPHTIGRVALAPPAAQIERAATRSSLESELQALQEQIAVVLGQHRQLLERSAALGANDAHQRSTQRRLEDLMRRAQRLAERRALRAPRREPATPSPEAMRLLERAAERRAALLAVTDAESPEDRADELYW